MKLPKQGDENKEIMVSGVPTQEQIEIGMKAEAERRKRPKSPTTESFAKTTAK